MVLSEGIQRTPSLLRLRKEGDEGGGVDGEGSKMGGRLSDRTLSHDPDVPSPEARRGFIPLGTTDI